MRIRVLIVAAAVLPLCNCAGLSLSTDPADAHLALGAAAGSYKLFCAAVGSTDFCSRQDQKLAKKAAKGVNGLIDQTAPPQ